MKSRLLFFSMTACAVIWTVMCFLPVVNRPASYVQALADHQQTPNAQTTEALAVSERNRQALQTTVWGLTFVSWIGVAVLFLTKQPPKQT
jgi:hypothetical protein